VHHCRVIGRFIAGLSIVLTSLVAGCGHSKSSSNTATQVVAKVNGREVTVSQLNQVLTSMNVPKSDPAAMKQALSRLITQELAVQAAQREKLDKDPQVRIRIEAARRAVLARAYEERELFKKVSIPDAERRRFYDQNPAFFGARRIYHFNGFQTSLTKLPAGLATELDPAHTVAAVKEILARYQIQFQIGDVIRGAENLPGDLAKRLATASVGDIVISSDATGHAQLMLLAHIDSAPIAFDQASDAIARYLLSQRNQAALSAALKELKSQAKIEYLDSAPAN